MDERIGYDDLELRRWRRSDEPELTEVVASSLAHIATFMPSAASEVSDPPAFLAGAEALWDEGTVFAYAIVRDGRIVGHCTLTPKGPSAEVGYWIRAEDTGQGLATAAVDLLSAAAFEAGFTRLEATCDEANIASARVLANVGFAIRVDGADDVHVRLADR